MEEGGGGGGGGGAAIIVASELKQHITWLLYAVKRADLKEVIVYAIIFL